MKPTATKEPASIERWASKIFQAGVLFVDARYLPYADRIILQLQSLNEDGALKRSELICS